MSLQTALGTCPQTPILGSWIRTIGDARGLPFAASRTGTLSARTKARQGFLRYHNPSTLLIPRLIIFAHISQAIENDFFEHGQIDIRQLVNIEAAFPGFMFAEPVQHL